MIIDSEEFEDENNQNIQQWLSQTLQLDQDDVTKYSSLFINNGYENISSLRDINEQTLINIGIDHAMHRRTLLSELKTTAGGDSDTELDSKSDGMLFYICMRNQISI